jgi:hypothetical protein
MSRECISYNDRTGETKRFKISNLRVTRKANGLTPDEHRFAMLTPQRHLARDELHEFWEKEDSAELMQERISDLKTIASANRQVLLQCGYGLLLQTIAGLHDVPELWVVERSEEALSAAVLISTNRALGIF